MTAHEYFEDRLEYLHDNRSETNAARQLYQACLSVRSDESELGENALHHVSILVYDKHGDDKVALKDQSYLHAASILLPFLERQYGILVS